MKAVGRDEIGQYKKFNNQMYRVSKGKVVGMFKIKKPEEDEEGEEK